MGAAIAPAAGDGCGRKVGARKRPADLNQGPWVRRAQSLGRLWWPLLPLLLFVMIITHGQLLAFLFLRISPNPISASSAAFSASSVSATAAGLVKSVRQSISAFSSFSSAAAASGRIAWLFAVVLIRGVCEPIAALLLLDSLLLTLSGLVLWHRARRQERLQTAAAIRARANKRATTAPNGVDSAVVGSGDVWEESGNSMAVNLGVAAPAGCDWDGAAASAASGGALPATSTWPAVLVQLPMYNEREVYARAIAAACNLEWPRGRLVVQVLDDSTDAEISRGMRAEVARWRSKLRCGGASKGARNSFGGSIDVRYRHRTDRTGYKAGNLREGLTEPYARACAFVAILDADFEPSPDWLLRSVAPLARDPQLALVQTRWAFSNESECLLTRLQAVELKWHFLAEQLFSSSALQCFGFNGTAGVWRTAAITDAGSWRDDTTVEDMDIAVCSAAKGWRMRLEPTVECASEVPAGYGAYRKQQHRWTSGPANLLRLRGGVVLTAERSALSWPAKLYFVGIYMFLRRAARHLIGISFWLFVLPAYLFSSALPSAFSSASTSASAFPFPWAMAALVLVYPLCLFAFSPSKLRLLPAYFLFLGALLPLRAYATVAGLLNLSSSHTWDVTQKLGRRGAGGAKGEEEAHGDVEGEGEEETSEEEVLLSAGETSEEGGEEGDTEEQEAHDSEEGERESAIGQRELRLRPKRASKASRDASMTSAASCSSFSSSSSAPSLSSSTTSSAPSSPAPLSPQPSTVELMSLSAPSTAAAVAAALAAQEATPFLRLLANSHLLPAPTASVPLSVRPATTAQPMAQPMPQSMNQGVNHAVTHGVNQGMGQPGMNQGASQGGMSHPMGQGMGPGPGGMLQPGPVMQYMQQPNSNPMPVQSPAQPAAQSQIVCTGCRTLLVYPNNAANASPLLLPLPSSHFPYPLPPCRAAAQSQIVCTGCRTLLVYPNNASNVRCALCSTITPVPQAGTEMAQLVCGGCRTLLMYVRGATSVQCSCCHTVNLSSDRESNSYPPARATGVPWLACMPGPHCLHRRWDAPPVASSNTLTLPHPRTNQVAHINCGGCGMTLVYAMGARSVKCAVCQFVTQVMVRATFLFFALVPSFSHVPPWAILHTSPPSASPPLSPFPHFLPYPNHTFGLLSILSHPSFSLYTQNFRHSTWATGREGSITSVCCERYCSMEGTHWSAVKRGGMQWSAVQRNVVDGGACGEVRWLAAVDASEQRMGWAWIYLCCCAVPPRHSPLCSVTAVAQGCCGRVAVAGLLAVTLLQLLHPAATALLNAAAAPAESEGEGGQLHCMVASENVSAASIRAWK
ncbi:unnamed protein product [Closterium sp. NIES-65]|nr:unnamed protein product [Closterium sp. NIES-65]